MTLSRSEDAQAAERVVSIDAVRGLVLDALTPGQADQTGWAQTGGTQAGRTQTPVAFTDWCPSPRAALRLLQLQRARVGDEVTVETGPCPEQSCLVQMRALDQPASAPFRRYAVRPMTDQQQREMALRTISEQVMELVSNLVVLLGPDGHLTYASQSAASLLGCTVEDLIGRPVTSLLSAPDRFRLRRDLIAPPPAAARIYRVCYRNGPQKVLDVSWSDLLDDPLVPSTLIVARDVTAEHTARQALAEQRAFYEAILEHLPYQVAVLDHQGRYRYANPAAIGSAEVRRGVLGLNDTEYCRWRGHDPQFALNRTRQFQAALVSGQRVNWEEDMTTPQGTPLHHQRHYLPILAPDGQFQMMIGYGRDDSERQRHLTLSLRQTQILQRAGQGTPLPELIAELVAALQEACPGGRAALTLDSAPTPGSAAPTPTPTPTPIGSESRLAAIRGDAEQRVIGYLRLSGPVGIPEPEALRVLDHLASLAGMVIERARHLETLETLAYVDSLTGLPNREALKRRFAAGVAADHHERVVVLVGFQRFRSINDRYGHAVGDALLVQAAARLQACLTEGAVAARLDGDEFALVVRAEEADAVVERVARDFGGSFALPPHSVRVEVQIGLSPESPGGVGIETLLQQAQHALHRARRLGQTLGRYDAGDHAVELTSLALESELRLAFERRELALAFQPLVDARTRTVESMEVLLRWPHPQRGPVSPEVFVALAEQSDLIVEIGRWVLREACLQAARWPGGPLRMNVNVSARQFEQVRFVDEVRAALRDSGLPPHQLELELTESALMTSDRAVIQVLDELHHLGVRLALDDYGTGYSSLAYLKRFPLDVLKIDRTFILDLGPAEVDSSDLAIVRSTIGLAHELGLQVVAEGVEHESQRRLLGALGCDLLQGFLFAAPMSLTDAQTWRPPAESPD
ncbi:sensor domain-containing protein [Deinococcus sp.]|uniref:sensor domain-containing protein n=1 Tax=Deinococcus sp. TaxID=47478 RepID=UPI003C7E06A4